MVEALENVQQSTINLTISQALARGTTVYADEYNIIVVLILVRYKKLSL